MNSSGALYGRVDVDVPGTSGLSASWPDGGPEGHPGVHVSINDGGQQLGVLSLTMPPGRPLRHEEQRLLERFAEQAGLALHNVYLEGQLRARVADAAAQAAALEASRRRLLDARDAERRRVATTIDQAVIARLEMFLPQLNLGDHTSADQAVTVLRRLDTATEETLKSLRQITRGLFPALLSRRGLVPAVRSELGVLEVGGVLQVEPELEAARFSAAIEATAYFCCLGVLATLSAPSSVRIALVDGLLVIDIEGPALARPPSWRTFRGPAEDQSVAASRWLLESGGLPDRLDAAGGTLCQESRTDGTVVVHIELPAVDPLLG